MGIKHRAACRLRAESCELRRDIGNFDLHPARLAVIK
jgi:hypothetical protein